MKEEQAIKLIIKEYGEATDKFGAFPSFYHGFAVIKEELDELWELIKENPHNNFIEEATQIGAMALRFLVDCC